MSKKTGPFISIGMAGGIFSEIKIWVILYLQIQTLRYICLIIFANNGFNFISVNYCFAPEYRYPAQILQYDQVLDYLNKHSAELHLNMNNVILAGSSGGAIYTT